MASAPLIVVMGVSGTGKSTVGAALAQRLRVAFVDGDDLHPAENVAKMSAGIALDDTDREPWLDRIGDWLAQHDATGGVVACSALKVAYRDRIRARAPRAAIVHLTGDHDVIAARQAGRPGHFMPSSLLDSQFATLEPLQAGEHGQSFDVARDVDGLVDLIAAGPLLRPAAADTAVVDELRRPVEGH